NGNRPQHVDRIEVDLQGDASAIADVANGTLDTVAATPDLSPQLAGLAQRYGVNRSRLFIQPDLGTRMFLINTSRPLFRNNVQLRQAVNFGADRRALVREYGRYAATATDRYVPSVIPGAQSGRIYPLRGPDLRRARALARGRARSGKAVLYTCSDRPACIGTAPRLQQNLRAIGIQVQVRRFPLQVMFQKLARPNEPFDLAWVGFVGGWSDPLQFLGSFDGRTIGQPDSENW